MISLVNQSLYEMRLVDECACHSLMSAMFSPRWCILPVLKVYCAQWTLLKWIEVKAVGSTETVWAGPC
jgi:hypothetical protein